MKKENVELNSLLTQEELALACSVSSESKVSFNSEDVPKALWPLIPYAALWGIADDWAREDVLKRTPPLIKKNLKLAVTKFEDELDSWLAGDEASSSLSTDAYIAFSAMRMAADFI